MKVRVVVKYKNIEPQEYVVSAGSGDYTFKWLALAAAQQFVERPPRQSFRRIRQILLERRNNNNKDDSSFSNLSLNENDDDCFDIITERCLLIPSDVYTHDCPFFHPEDKVKDHLQNGYEITVELCNKLCTDDYGEPILSKWAFIAFKLSERNHIQREKYIQEKKLEILENRLRRESELLRHKLEKERPQILKMREILSEQLCDKKVIEEIWKNEWKIILANGALDDVLSGVSSDEQNDIYNFFMEHYIELSDMYKFFSAVNSGGGTDTMEYIEFNKFLIETNIFGTADHSSILLKIFLGSAIYDTMNDESTSICQSAANIAAEIHQHQFFICLVRIAIYNYSTLQKQRFTTLKNKGHEASIAKVSTPSCFEALQSLYHEYLLPFIRKKATGATIKKVLGSDEILLLFNENIELLGSLFVKYSSEIGNNPSDKELVMQGDDKVAPKDANLDLKQFTNLVNDAFVANVSATSVEEGLETHEETVITLKDVRQIFSASQQDTIENEEEQKSNHASTKGQSLAQHRHEHHMSMDFAEYLEAVARIGVMKRTEPLPIKKKIEWAIKKVCTLSIGRE